MQLVQKLGLVTKLDKKDKALLQAINDDKHHVKIHAIDGSTDSSIWFGRDDHSKEKNTSEHTIAFGQAAILDQPQNAGGLTSSDVAGHETLEGFYESTGNGGDAHRMANQYFSGLDQQGKVTSDAIVAGTVVGAHKEFNIANSKLKEVFTLKLVTPIPLATLKQHTPDSLPSYPVNAKTEKK